MEIDTRIGLIEEKVREYEGIDDGTDVADLIADELRSNPDRTDTEVARAVVQRITQP
jgi:hypothetical protein